MHLNYGQSIYSSLFFFFVYVYIFNGSTLSKCEVSELRRMGI